MELNKQFHRRLLIVAVLLLALMGCMGLAMYDLQILQGEEMYEKAQYRIAETQTVEADRGDILDRNGRVLVSNETVYQVTLDFDRLGEPEERADTLLSLVRISRTLGLEWSDNFPVSHQPPFTYTSENPFVSASVNEEGATTYSRTRLTRLGITMGWFEDPLRLPESEEVEEVPQPETPGFFDRLKAFFTGEEVEEPLPPPEEEEEGLPDPDVLLSRMAESFKLPVEEMTSQELRDVCGVLYELYLREKGIYWTDYIFAEDVDISFITRVKEAGLSGVEIEPTTRRAYHTDYAAHLLGRVGLMSESEVEYYTNLDTDGDGKADYERNDTVGKDGVERAFEAQLRGTAGVRTVERNTEGKVVSTNWLAEPRPGDNVVLTLDIDLQKKVEDSLAAALPNLPSQEAEGAACVVLDVNTADVLACASYPSFSLATYSADYNENLSDPLKPFLNRALQGVYPPGSTFKMVTGIAGLEEGIITPTTLIRDTGRYMYYAPGYTPACWIYNQRGGSHGNQNVSDAIMNSCNVFFYDVGRQLGIDRIGDYAGRFGLAQKTGLELYEEEGIMAGPAYTESLGGTWYDGSTLSVAIGQESSQFTPIQLANYIATLVNGGTRNATHLLKEVKSSDYSRIISTHEGEVLSTVEIQDKNLDAVKLGMLKLTTQGSVRKYFTDVPFQVGAKTGSAQVSADSESNAVFVCFAPYENPEVAMAIVVEHGGSGGELAGIAADVLSYHFSSRESREAIDRENTLIQ